MVTSDTGTMTSRTVSGMAFYYCTRELTLSLCDCYTLLPSLALLSCFFLDGVTLEFPKAYCLEFSICPLDTLILFHGLRYCMVTAFKLILPVWIQPTYPMAYLILSQMSTSCTTEMLILPPTPAAPQASPSQQMATPLLSCLHQLW